MSAAVEAGVQIQAGALKPIVDFRCAPTRTVLRAGFKRCKAATSPDSLEPLCAMSLDRVP